jgi:hypothetical protein
MRGGALALVVAVMVALAGRHAETQVYRHETPPPLVTAAGEAWQVNGEPVFYAGNYYYPAGATVFFDGKVMVRTGVYRGVPLYADVTLEPYSIVYVPIGGAIMRPYERRREGDLAGTVGSRTPSFPIDRAVELSAAAAGTTGMITPRLGGSEPLWAPQDDYVWMRMPRSALESRSGSAVPPLSSQQPPATGAVQEPFTASGVITIAPAEPGASGPTSPTYGNAASASQQPAPRAAENGVWVDFDGARWYSAGTAVHYDPSRFEAAGEYHGFPVYRERGGAADRIFVTVVHDGPLAPFARR